MFKALDKNKNRIVHISEALEHRDDEYCCPICKQPVLIRNGDINADHFAHKKGSDCDSFSSDMSAWHLEWQNRFPKVNQEVIRELNTTKFAYSRASNQWNFGECCKMDFVERMEHFENDILNPDETPIHIVHRADVCACGYVIEFQHSALSRSEFNERNWFYTECGFRVIWIFDMQDEVERYKKMCIYDEDGDTVKWRWDYPSKTFTDFCPQNNKRWQDENGVWQKEDILLFFQTDEENLERVVWAIHDEDEDTTSYSRFFTDNRKYQTVNSFVEAVKSKRL